jgi:propionate CoA-transferase
VRYITERAVFALSEGGITLIEIADGLRAEADVIGHMGFRPMVADELRIMDARLFRTEPMGLAADFARAAEGDAP